MSDKIKRKSEWVKMISGKELENRLKEAKVLAKTAKEKISFYEKEIERRRYVPLGVPAERKAYTEAYFVNCTGAAIDQPLDPNDSYDKEIFDMLNVFESEASAEKHAEMLLTWRQALVDNAKGEPIDIKVLCPLLEKGKVAFCPISRSWFWTNKIPQLSEETWETLGSVFWIGGFNIKPAEDWKTSLMECGL